VEVLSSTERKKKIPLRISRDWTVKEEKHIHKKKNIYKVTTNHFRKCRSFINKELQQVWLVGRAHKVDHNFRLTSCNIPGTKII